MERRKLPGRIKPHVCGGVAFALLAFAYCFLTPPFRAPDEQNHFFRAFHVSEFGLFAHRLPNGLSGDDLPASLRKLGDALGAHDDNRVTATQLAAARAIDLEAGNREPVEFSNTVLYSPVTYLPAALGIRLGTTFDANPFYLLYLARIANVLTASCLIGLALARVGFAWWPAILTATLPMAVSQMALVTADAMTFAFSFFWIAHVARLAVTDAAPLSRKSVASLFAFALVLSQFRPPYPVLALLIFAVSPRRFGGKTTAIATYGAIILAAALPAVAWNAAARPLFVPEPGYDLEARLTLLQENPGAFVREVRNDIVRRGTERWSQIVGRLGWLNIRIPPALTTAYAAALVACCFLGTPPERRPHRWQRLVLFMTALAGVVGIQLLLFVTYNVGWVQGRYFIPFVMLLAFAGGGIVIANQRARAVLMVASAAVALSTHAAALFAIAEAQR